MILCVCTEINFLDKHEILTLSAVAMWLLVTLKTVLNCQYDWAFVDMGILRCG